MPRKIQPTTASTETRKNFKPSRGISNFYEEKKGRINLTLTPTAMDGLNKLSSELNLSISEFVERIGRGVIPVSSPNGVDNDERIAQTIVALLEKSQASRNYHPVNSEEINNLTQALQKLGDVAALLVVGQGGVGKSSLLKNFLPERVPEAQEKEDELLTTQKAWELAKSRGYAKSKDAFRNWSRKAPEECQQLTGLIAIADKLSDRLLGYQDTH